jgi:hypothetical protein
MAAAKVQEFVRTGAARLSVHEDWIDPTYHRIVNFAIIT